MPNPRRQLSNGVEKLCYTCGQLKPLAAFWRQRATSTGRQSSCADCQRAKKYGMDGARLASLLQAQRGCCAICGGAAPKGRGAFHVDHDHDTGAVRGLLCATCNAGLGQFGDSPELLRAAAEYIERSRACLPRLSA